MFSHHPDVLHYMWRAFTDLGHDVYVATEELTKAIGFPYSSVKQNKFEVVDQLFYPSQLFPDMIDVKWMYSIEQLSTVDMLWSMLPSIMSLNRYKKTWFDAQMQNYLREPSFRNIQSIKTANHPDAQAINNFTFIPNWVDYQPELKEKKYITQLITECNLVSETKTLLELRNLNHPVKIHGGNKCPDGFIRDIEILPYTALLVHNKQFGINCYAVCKALDMGIPVYMSKYTKTLIGFDDLPDSLFIFSEYYSILEAYKKALSMDNKKIQEEYRSIYTLDRTKQAVQSVLK